MKKCFVFLVLFLLVGNALATGENVYNTNCVLCHGKDGTGNTSLGIALKPHPANFNESFTTKKYKTSADLKNHILDVLAKGKPGTGMAAFSSLSQKDKDEVTDFLIGKYYKGK